MKFLVKAKVTRYNGILNHNREVPINSQALAQNPFAFAFYSIDWHWSGAALSRISIKTKCLHFCAKLKTDPMVCGHTDFFLFLETQKSITTPIFVDLR